MFWLYRIQDLVILLHTITDFLSSINVTFDVLNITTSNLNNSADAGKINQATCFIFAR